MTWLTDNDSKFTDIDKTFIFLLILNEILNLHILRFLLYIWITNISIITKVIIANSARWLVAHEVNITR